MPIYFFGFLTYRSITLNLPSKNPHIYPSIIPSQTRNTPWSSPVPGKILGEFGTWTPTGRFRPGLISIKKNQVCSDLGVSSDSQISQVVLEIGLKKLNWTRKATKYESNFKPSWMVNLCSLNLEIDLFCTCWLARIVQLRCEAWLNPSPKNSTSLSSERWLPDRIHGSLQRPSPDMKKGMQQEHLPKSWPFLDCMFAL